MYMANRALESALFPSLHVEKWAVAHCNFHLRGEESDGDEEFVRQWCADHDVEFFCTGFDTVSYARECGLSTEMAARELRYDWFAELCSQNGFDAVVVAHNSDDNAETLLLNMLRGCGSRGMRGMSEDSGEFPRRVLRPLLQTSREEILNFMATRGLSWREDRTNAEDIYKRNLLRHRVLPVFKDINPAALRTLSQDMAHIREVDDIASDYYMEHRRKVGCFTDLFKLKHWKYILYRELEARGFGQGVYSDLCALLESGRPASGKRFHSPLWTLNLSSEGIHFTPFNGTEPSNECVLVEGEGTFELAGRSFTVKAERIRDSLKTAEGEILASPRALSFPFWVRTWREGDWMQPIGMKGRKKISDLFTDLHIPAYLKERELVLVADPDESEVLALLCRRPSEKIKVCREADPEILSIKEITTSK